MKKTLLIISCSLFFGGALLAQQGDGGVPRTSETVLKSMNIDKRTFNTPDLLVLKAEDDINDIEKTGPWRFGHNNYTNLNLDNSGTWTDLANGGKIWQIALTCEEALTVNLTFENVLIPEGNELYVFSPKKDFILGRFKQSHTYNGELGTELVPGSTALVEYYVSPENVSASKSLTITTVTHGYRTAQEFQEKAFGSSAQHSFSICAFDSEIFFCIVGKLSCCKI